MSYWLLYSVHPFQLSDTTNLIWAEPMGISFELHLILHYSYSSIQTQIYALVCTATYCVLLVVCEQLPVIPPGPGTWGHDRVKNGVINYTVELHRIIPDFRYLVSAGYQTFMTSKCQITFFTRRNNERDKTLIWLKVIASIQICGHVHKT